MGVAKAERRQKFDFRFRIGNGFANEIFAGDAEMYMAGGQLRDNVGGGNKRDLDILHAGQISAIVARAVHEFEPRAAEKSRGVFLQPPFGGNREHERFFGAAYSHGATRSALRRPIQIAAPAAGKGVSATSVSRSCSSRPPP